MSTLLISDQCTWLTPNCPPRISTMQHTKQSLLQMQNHTRCTRNTRTVVVVRETVQRLQTDATTKQTEHQRSSWHHTAHHQRLLRYLLSPGETLGRKHSTARHGVPDIISR